MMNKLNRVCVTLLSGLAAVLPLGGHAAVELTPYVAGNIEYDNNVLRLPDNRAALEARGSPRREDTLRNYVVGVDAALSWGARQLNLGASANRTEYNRFEDLDGEGYNFTASTDWRVGNSIRGGLSAQLNRSPEEFEDRVIAVTERGDQDTLSVNLNAAARVLTRFEIRPSVGLNRTRNSLETSRQQDVDQQTYGLGLTYVGFARGELGLDGSYSRGKFIRRPPGEDIIDETELTTVQLAGRWNPSPITTVSGGIGVTRNDDNGRDTDAQSSLVGNLNINRQISVKTSVNAGVFQTVSVADRQGESTARGTGWNVGGSWKPTSRLDLTVEYSSQRDEFGNSATRREAGFGSVDDFERVNLSTNIALRRWLSLGPYYRWEHRDSDLPRGNYEAFQVGVEMRMSLP